MSTCLVSGGSSNDTAPIAVLLMNIMDNQTWFDHVIIYHDGISTRDRKLMQKIAPVEFIRYSFPGKKSNFNEIVKYSFREMVFAKYECFRLLEKFDRVVWSDYDVVYLQDVPEIANDNPHGYKSLIYRPDTPTCLVRDQFRRDSWPDLEKLFDLDKLSIATGFFALSRDLPHWETYYDDCIALTEKYGYCLVLPDQGVLDMVVQKHHFEPDAIPWTYAAHPITDAHLLDEAKVLHSYSRQKFWSGVENAAWNERYQKWLAMGGTPYGVFSCRESWRKIKCSLTFRLNKLKKKFGKTK